MYYEISVIVLYNNTPLTSYIIYIDLGDQVVRTVQRKMLRFSDALI
jgi:hypothetical protein